MMVHVSLNHFYSCELLPTHIPLSNPNKAHNKFHQVGLCCHLGRGDVYVLFSQEKFCYIATYFNYFYNYKSNYKL